MSDAPPSPKHDMTEGALLRITAFQGTVFTALGLGIWVATGRAAPDWLSFGLYDIKIGLLSTAGLILLGLCGYFFPRISAYLITMQRETYGWLTKFNSWRVIIIISFFAGVWEEALFRGGAQVWLTDHLGAPLAILIASAIFALVHFSKPVIGFVQFLIGCLFGVIYWQTGSLLGVMLAHFLYDIFALWYLLRELTRLERKETLGAPE
ncbi:CPBP family intramembrane metalloprotease [Qipengyuania sp. S6317L1]|uniref:CPBP family intramembrane glutamic endopeptidase n=1 Tax=Qipengyuania sp. S6317L1 TaxID=2926410 RepID=UPI001FF59DAE|nr:CPBP family intramembrane glutamic endopeptidase [Qipengyuania sp. S6317L1]MCK0100607.1 CPBP family intramembrane metalloprotease [Qipengyuania sp. S6317L1]